MSSRQLRKLQQQREQEQARLQAQEEEESDDEPPVQQKPRASLFASFGALDVEDDQDDEDEDQGETPEPANEPKPEPTIAPAAKKSKKSKKKKKGKNKEMPAEPEDRGNSADDIDAALRELALKPSLKGSSTEPVVPVDPEYERVCTLLGINSQHLKVANEMRTLFGKSAIENHDDAGGAVPRSGRGRRQRALRQEVDLETALKGRHAPGKGLSEVTLRRNCFIQGKEEWPKATTGGLTMAVVDDKAADGTVEFRFVHDNTYQDVQGSFHTFVELGEPRNLIGMLTQHPYNISLLIQVSKIAKDQTDHALSSDLLERALFTFGRAATSLFSAKLQEGKARLDFTRPENRELWLAGYHYIKSLIMKGTYRTALEWAKVLLSLDPEGDPYCMRLMIHHLGIRAHETEWLLSVADSKLSDCWVVEGVEQQNAIHTSPSFAYAALLLKQGLQSRTLLEKSMRSVPWLFVRLFGELNLDAPPSIWGIVPRTDAEKLFTEIYVLQTKDLWGTPEATALLMEIAHTIPKGSIDLSSIAETKNTEMTLDVARFTYLDNNPAIMRMVPGKLLHRSNNSDSDPIPPEKNTYSYPAQAMALERGQADPSNALGDDFHDPIAAIARIIPGFGEIFERNAGARGNAEQDFPELPEGLNDEMNGEERVGFARRIMNMLWSSGVAEDEWDDESDINTETTDSEMPRLESSESVHEGDSEVEDGEEMPGLVEVPEDEYDRLPGPLRPWL